MSVLVGTLQCIFLLKFTDFNVEVNNGKRMKEEFFIHNNYQIQALLEYLQIAFVEITRPIYCNLPGFSHSRLEHPLEYSRMKAKIHLKSSSFDYVNLIT